MNRPEQKDPTWDPARPGFYSAFLLSLFFLFIIGVALSLLVGWNPYVGAAVAMGSGVLYTTYRVARQS